MYKSRLRQFVYSSAMLSVCGIGLAANNTAMANDPIVPSDDGLYYFEPDPNVLFPETLVSPSLYGGNTTSLHTCMVLAGYGGQDVYNIILRAQSAPDEIIPGIGAQWVIKFEAEEITRIQIENGWDFDPVHPVRKHCGILTQSADQLFSMEGIVELFESGDLNGTYQFMMQEEKANVIPRMFTLRQRDLIRLPLRDGVIFSFANDADFRGQTSSYAINQKPTQVLLDLPVCSANLNVQQGNQTGSLPLSVVSGVTSSDVSFTYTESGQVRVNLTNAGIGSHEIEFMCSASSGDGQYTATPIKRVFTITEVAVEEDV